MRDVITQSEMTAFGRCEERHNNRYNRRLVPFVEHPALRDGKAVHAGLQYGSAERAVVELRGPDRMWSLWEGEGFAKREATISAMVTGALNMWDIWPETHELEFDVPLLNPKTKRPSRKHSLHGVFDGVWGGTHPRFPGEVVLGEWKTASQVGRDYIQRLEIDFQVSTYCWAASRLFGTPVRKVVYRVIKKPTIRQKQTEEVEEYIDRVKEDYLQRQDHYFTEVVVERTDEQLQGWMVQAWETHRRILSIRKGAPAIRSTQSCLSRGRCPYFDLCVGAVTEDAFRRLESKHPELGGNA